MARIVCVNKYNYKFSQYQSSVPPLTRAVFFEGNKKAPEGA